MTYIENRCNGAAMTHLVPCCQKNALRSFIIGEEMFDPLEKVYDNPNCQYILINKVRALQWKDKNFNTFWVEILRLLADLDHENATFIFKLTHKLTSQLQSQLTAGDSQPIDFYKYVK